VAFCGGVTVRVAVREAVAVAVAVGIDSSEKCAVAEWSAVMVTLVGFALTVFPSMVQLSNL
jgi:hypothetical protein